MKQHGVALSNVKLLQKWRVLPLHLEVHARRLRWLQTILRKPWDNEQVTAALFGTMNVEGVNWNRELPSLDSHGKLSTWAPALAHAFEDALLAFEGISGSEGFFEAWNAVGRSWKVLLLSKPLQLQLDKLDAKLLLASFVTDSSLEKKMERLMELLNSGLA